MENKDLRSDGAILDDGMVDRLAAWMDVHHLAVGAPIEASVLQGGTQNEIVEIARGGLHCVMRKPPIPPPPGREDGIIREYRIIEALAGTDVPHTPAIALCTDPSVIGASFYLMGHVDGWSPMGMGGSWPEPFRSDPAVRPGLAFELIDGIAELAGVDWRSRGLADLGRPDGFHDRQVDRWLRFFERVRTREVPGLDVASDWLRANRPLDYEPGIMHGDYQFANVMFEHGAPARLAAIVDWEMGTVGDPKLDLAWVVQAWPAAGEPVPAMGYVDYEGLPPREALLDRYAERSGRQVDDIDYYVVLARWKLAIVLEQGYARSQRGEGDVEKMAAFGDIVLGLMAGAAELAERTDYRNSRGW